MEIYLITALLIVSVAILILLIILLASNKNTVVDSKLDKAFEKTEKQQKLLREEITESIHKNMYSYGKVISDHQLEEATKQEERFKTFALENTQKLENIRNTVEKRLEYLQTDNNKKLEEMRNTVDEKLQKTLESKMNESFKLVNERLEQVYKGLGEMQTLATGVGDLKKVLSNVKTRGILGEIQLGAILKEILSPEQYDENVITKKGSTNRVEFAVKLPSDDGGFIYLPIDSKFPGDTYYTLQEAYESSVKENIDKAVHNLITRIKTEAKDISDKYIDVPNTTNFAIMFLPFEGLYSEVVNRGMVEVLQNDYKVNIAGPSTMAALLNSLQMGFKTLAVQKRSTEVWTVLGEVKTEFEKFNEALVKTQQKIRQADSELDELVGRRSRAMERRLREVQTEKLLIEDTDIK